LAKWTEMALYIYKISQIFHLAIATDQNHMQYYSTRFEKPQDEDIQSGKPCPWSSYFGAPYR